MSLVLSEHRVDACAGDVAVHGHRLRLRQAVDGGVQRRDGAGLCRALLLQVGDLLFQLSDSIRQALSGGGDRNREYGKQRQRRRDRDGEYACHD